MGHIAKLLLPACFKSESKKWIIWCMLEKECLTRSLHFRAEKAEVFLSNLNLLGENLND